MPEPARLAAFAAAALGLVLLPGPNLLYIVTRSVAQGRRAGLFSALGVETGTLVHVSAAVVGVSALVARSEVAFAALKYAGAAYLLYLGVRALFSRTPAATPGTAEPVPLTRVYWDAVLVQVLNPKVILFFLAFLPQFVTPGAGPADTRGQLLVLGLLLGAIGFCVDCVYAYAGGSLSAWLARRPAALRRQRHAVGGVYLGLGVYAAV
ncbi:LysE family translocator [Streptomyces sp. A7024]|uniref:LysE family translocator n=1 Tax=Streptomyces coryli TaxID=1128680 RepID=A0A6G4U6B4_9ACTN|nr:LysE family translocator [Streptomyces coryli]NGN66837.1 LysE family translocator [Streptomyces coryli]